MTVHVSHRSILLRQRSDLRKEIRQVGIPQHDFPVRQQDFVEKTNNPLEQGRVEGRTWRGSISDVGQISVYRRVGRGETGQMINSGQHSRPTIFCDMDGVLVDWDGGVERLFGMSIAEVRECYPDKRERYERIVALDPDFYQNLRWMPEGAVLWKFLEPFGPVLLTAYSKYVPRGASLKAAWAKRELGLPPDRVLAYSNKGEKRQHALNPDGSANVLVDDEPPNVDDWVAAGGLGILHTSTAETIRRLEKLGFARPD